MTQHTDVPALPTVAAPTLEPWRGFLFECADYIDAHGLLKGRFGFRGGPTCAIGSMVVCANGPHYYQVGVIAEATRAVVREIGSRNIAAWNDQPERTAAEVVATLRAAAVSA